MRLICINSADPDESDDMVIRIYVIKIYAIAASIKFIKFISKNSF